MTTPLEHEPDLAQVVDDVEQIAPLAVLLAAAVIGVAATGGFHLLIVPSALVDLVLFLSNLLSRMW
ncbi:hypothetical protein SAMN04488074_105134 [Lentzea albidocapillata subsp. violacea]|uniref:Uncharacterized protein n=1 Tax=Lentzea albidocapillata subsp. violacea TaxID=128104 RepID=A0A1G9AW09_9PSEU|nr:hypothetical protein [Lentzea albidocapillata]SDK31423.1 hypothetical protein SAMN04488074_105134 [Lentzea albidocapillata subsp. violacea]